MSGVTRLLSSAAASCCVAVLAGAAPAQQILPVQALTRLTEPLVRAIATYGRPIQLPSGPGFKLEEQTAEQVISARCGAVQPGYFDEFLKLNSDLLKQNGREKLQPGEVLGTLAPKIVLPACVIVALPGAGGAGTGGTRPGISKAGAAVAPTVELAPKDGETIATLTSKIAANVNPDGGSDEVVWAPPRMPSGGTIIASVEASAEAQAESCPAVHDPFDARQVAAYYTFAAARSKQLKFVRRDVIVWVIDNGFYGVDPSANPPVGPAFPQAYFADWWPDGQGAGAGAGYVGPMVPVQNGIIYPLINRQDTPPSTLSSHGTHVAGLVLGGPNFLPYRDVFKGADPNSPWIHLGIVNLANGKESLVNGSQGPLLGVLSGRVGQSEGRIINMSVAYYEGLDEQLGSTFQTLLNQKNDLFIVAAGNDGDDVRHLGIYPASLGGTSANIITVAAHDDSDPVRLAAFSNHGRDVDIAAPGCSLLSWTDMTATQRLSGTSQAAPLVTFAAEMLRSLDADLTPGDIKARLLASADRFDADPTAKVRPRLKLNIAKALLLFDDYLRLKTGETYVGAVEGIKGLRCQGDTGSAAWGRRKEEIVAYRTDIGKPTIVLKDQQPGGGSCDADVPTAPQDQPLIKFRSLYRLNGYILSDATGPVDPVPLSSVAELVMRAPAHRSY